MNPKQLLDAIINYFVNWQPSDDVEADYLSQVVTELRRLDNPRRLEPQGRPVLDQWFESAVNGPIAAKDQPLIDLLKEEVYQLPWVTSPGDYVSPEFAANYGFTMVSGPRIHNIDSALYVSDRVACGFAFQGPGQFYPPHYHEAVEFYGLIAGEGRWQKGYSAPVLHKPGTQIFHNSNVPHAMETLEKPMMNVFAWVGNMSNSRSTIPSREWLQEKRGE